MPDYIGRTVADLRSCAPILVASALDSQSSVPGEGCARFTFSKCWGGSVAVQKDQGAEAD